MLQIMSYVEMLFCCYFDTNILLCIEKTNKMMENYYFYLFLSNKIA